MPLRDHFRSPLDDELSWEGFHGGWPMMIVAHLGQRLPPRYVAAPRVRLGTSVEIDVATFHNEESETNSLPGWNAERDDSGAVGTSTWAPPQATLTVATDLPAQDEYEVRVYDTRRGRRLVAAVELVSPANKDRPEHRRAFLAKCAAFLQEQVSVVIVDLVTTRQFNLYSELLELMGHADLTRGTARRTIYGAAFRTTRRNHQWVAETWFDPLELGQPLPTLPLWLADNLAVPLELEASYEETCRILRLA